jgi:acyl-coenzyme A synthetase/AMP-(fatty) acid ligase
VLDPSNRIITIDDSWFAPAQVATQAGAQAGAQAFDLPESFRGGADVVRHAMTSGTTGAPKIITDTAGEIGSRIACLLEVNWSVGLCMPGLSSIWAYVTACATLATGRTLCFAVSPHQAIRMVELFAIDCVTASTEQLLALTRVAKKQNARLDSIRTVWSGGTVPSPPLIAAAMMHVCRNIIWRYASTEAGLIAQASAGEVMAHPGLAGHVAPGAEVQVVDAEGRLCPPGGVGLIRCRPKWRKRDREWIDLGDIGRLDASGRLFVFGRAMPADADGQVAAGVSPADEVVHLMRLEWDVADAAATIVENSTGEPAQIWLGVVQGKDVDPRRVEALARANGIEHPVRLFQLNAIPRVANGKTDRQQLKAMMLATAAPPAQ